MAKNVEKITIQDLEAEYKIPAKQIRVLLRKEGFSAPKLDGAEGFGPKTKYEWDSDSKDLEKIDKILTAFLSNPPVKRGKKKAEEVEENDEETIVEDEDIEEVEEEEEVEEKPKKVKKAKKAKK